MKMGGRKPIPTHAQYERVREVVELKRSLPTQRELAEELGISIHTVARWVREGIKRYDVGCV